MSKFFVIMKMDVKIYMLYYVIFFVLEGVGIDEVVVIFELLLVVDMLFILN